MKFGDNVPPKKVLYLCSKALVRSVNAQLTETLFEFNVLTTFPMKNERQIN